MPLLKPAEAAELLAVKPRTLKDWRSTGVGPRIIRMPTGHVRYTTRDLAAWLQAGQREPTPVAEHAAA